MDLLDIRRHSPQQSVSLRLPLQQLFLSGDQSLLAREQLLECSDVEGM